MLWEWSVPSYILQAFHPALHLDITIEREWETENVLSDYWETGLIHMRSLKGKFLKNTGAMVTTKS